MSSTLPDSYFSYDENLLVSRSEATSPLNNTPNGTPLLTRTSLPHSAPATVASKQRHVLHEPR